MTGVFLTELMGPLGMLSGLARIGEVEVLLVAALFVRGLVRVGLLKPLTCVREGGVVGFTGCFLGALEP